MKEIKRLIFNVSYFVSLYMDSTYPESYVYNDTYKINYLCIIDQMVNTVGIA
jgi:hypothetical protein